MDECKPLPSTYAAGSPASAASDLDPQSNVATNPGAGRLTTRAMQEGRGQQALDRGRSMTYVEG